jgi:hypothetical protein
VIEQTQIYTTRCLKSSGEVFRLSQLEAEFTRTMRVVAIGSTEGRRLYAHRARVREELAAARARAESECILEDPPSSAVERFAGGRGMIPSETRAGVAQ